jgi:hypothetical protein
MLQLLEWWFWRNFLASLAQKGDDRRRMDCPCIICCRGPSL